MKEIRCEVADWIHLPKVRVQLLPFVKTVMNL